MFENYELILSYLKSAWRFRWLAFGVAWLVCIVGWAYVGLMPDVYESSTRVYVDTTSDLRRLLETQIVESDVEDQLALVQETMLGRVQLARVAAETGLDEGLETAGDKDRMLFFLSREIRITGGGVDHRGQRDNMYSISYQHQDREKSVHVVETLLSSFVDNLLHAKQSQSEATGQFLREQIADYEQRLQAAEQDLATFNRLNFDRLPGLQGGYFEQLQTASEAKEAAEKELRIAMSRLDSIEKQAEGEAPRTFNIDEVDPNSVEGRMFSVETRLNELLLRYTDNHPDVVAARETLVLLKKQRDEAFDNNQGLDGAATAVNNPVLQALLIARNEAVAEVATLRADVADRTARVNKLRKLLDETPEVEAELAKLNRDYDVVHERYQSLLISLEREQLSRQVFLSEQVDFRVVDPPTASLEPVAPNRFVLIVFVFLLACGGGAGVALLISQLKPVFQDSNHLQRKFDLPVIGSVSALSDSHRLGGSWLAYSLSLSTLGIGLIVVLFLELSGPGVRGILQL